jgi:hypothetical protein
MGFLRYYGTVARVAFTHSLSIAQAVIFVLAILVGGVAYFVPKTQAILTPWITGLNGWQVATGVLGAIRVELHHLTTSSSPKWRVYLVTDPNGKARTPGVITRIL